MDRGAFFDALDGYFAQTLAEHGATPRGVDWNSAEAQEVRFDQLLRVVDPSAPFSLLDYGCGYGALAPFMAARDWSFAYTGYDVSERMIAAAPREDPSWRFTSDEAALEPVDYAVASGLLNLRLDVDDETWRDYCVRTIAELARLGRRGFAFNMLTRYSDPDRMRADLYYADPCFFFDLVKREHAFDVALLHDYGLYEFTILGRR